jgi:hypothetical protein
MSIKLPVELLAKWAGEPPSGYSDDPSPVPGTTYRLRIEKHRIDANAVGVRILARADGSGGYLNWGPMHSDANYPLSVNWTDIRLVDGSLPAKASWM